MHKNILVFLLLSVFYICSCSNHSKKSVGFGYFDISVDDKYIIFSYVENNESSIYSINIVSGVTKKIISSNLNVNYYNPKYSPDSKKIVFIENKKNEVSSTLCVANIDGTNLVRLTGDKEIITEAIFSMNAEQIYFCKANVYEQYSPLAKKDAHDFDVYTVFLKDKRITKITNFKSYGLSHISEVNDDHILVHKNDGVNSGIYLCSKDDDSFTKQIVPINNPRKDASLYYTPIYSDSLKLIGFTAPYELYVMSTKDKKAELVFSNKGSTDLNSLVFYKNQPKILFSKVKSADLYSINIDGTELRKITISLQ